MGKVKKAIRGALKAFASGGWDGDNLSIFNPDHPLNRGAAYGGGSAYGNREDIENDFEGYVGGAFKSNGPVFACIQARQYVFSEITFKFRRKSDGTLFGGPELGLLENPWPGGTTGELLARMEQDVSLAGNSWWTLTNDAGQYGNAAKGTAGARLAHMRPDWVTMVIGTKRKGGNVRDIDATLLGIKFKPGGRKGIAEEYDEVFLTPEEFIHYSPTPDPTGRFRGMSWITPVVQEIEADKGATKHKGAFFANAAVPNMAVTFDKETNPDDFNEFVDKFNGSHQGAWQAYKTLFLMGGADVTPLSHDFKSMDFSAVVGKGESRIASCAGVPPSWVGFSEGMQGSALNSGNMAANRRRFADGTIRPLWRIAAASLAVLVDVPAGAELWFDESEVAFLREDQRDRAEIMKIDMGAVNTAILAGYEPDAAVDAVMSNDMKKLTGKHTGLVSVQMQPPVDPTNERDDVVITGMKAKTLQQFLDAGMTFESSIEAAEKNDLTLLKKDPAAAQWSPEGRPLMTAPGAPAPPGGAATPPAAGAKPPAKPPTSGTQPQKGANDG